MASGKKIGGVKQRQGATPVVAASKPTKKIGGVKEVRGFASSKQMESCPENCPGEYVEGGFWIHSRNCPWAAVLWHAYGFTEKDWACPYDCDPTTLPSGWTHDYRCLFWDRTGRTPIDHNPPRYAQHVEKAHDLVCDRLDTGDHVDGEVSPVPIRVSHAKKKGNRNQRRGKSVNYAEFPKPLRESDDDLPF